MSIHQILMKIGFVHRFETVMDVAQEDFLQKLRGVTRYGDPHDAFARFSELFAGNLRYRYFGRVDMSRFYIRARGPEIPYAVATANVRTEGNRLKISTEVNSLFTLWKVYFIIMAVLFGAWLLKIILLGGSALWLVIPFFLFFLGLGIGLPMLLLRYRTRSLTTKLQVHFRQISSNS